jgi:iron complex transport system ATP-binding protein
MEAEPVSVLVTATGLAIARRLSPVSLALYAGECVGLIGPNGSGKTSLLHALAAIPPATGSLSVGGQDPRMLHPNQRQRLLGFLPAVRDVVWPLKARHLLELALPPGGDWGPIAERFELTGLLDRRMDQLSTGERSRVMLVRTLAADPELLLLDEPLANLDPYWQLALLRELRTSAQRGKAIIVAIHDLHHALEWSERLLVMNERAVVGDCTPAEAIESGLIERVFRVDVDQAIRSADPQSSP